MGCLLTSTSFQMNNFRPPSGNDRVGGEVRSYPQLRCSAACSGFHIDVSLQDTAQLTHDTVHLPSHPIRPLSGNMCGGVLRLCPQLRCSAACSGFHIDVSLQDTAHLTHDTVHLTPHPIRPPSGNMCGGVCIYPQLRCFAACSGFHIDVSLQDTAQLTHGTVHLTHDTAISHRTPYVPRRGTDYLKPTASCEAAPLWV